MAFDLDDSELRATRILNGVDKEIEVDATAKYGNMLEAFECDFNVYEVKNGIAPDGTITFKFPISDKLFKDIDLLRELSFNLRHGKAKIIEVKE